MSNPSSPLTDIPTLISACRGAGAQGAFLNFAQNDTHHTALSDSESEALALQPWLYEHGFTNDDLNARYRNQTTPLMHAAHLGDAPIVKTLLEAGADLSLCNADGNNALWLACFSNDLVTMQTLLDAGIDLNHRNDNGSTCLMYAASASKPAVLKLLLTAGADVHLENLDGFTALDMAASLECLQLLRAQTQTVA